jgi:isocitrate dehydrogenase (NAD+)
MSDGMFLSACREVAKDFPDVAYDEDLLDRVCLQVTQNPLPFSDRVMVMPNLYGDILSDMCAGLIGGLGLTPSGNIGRVRTNRRYRLLLEEFNCDLIFRTPPSSKLFTDLLQILQVSIKWLDYHIRVISYRIRLGKGLANPTALLLSSLMMLRHMNLYEHANKIEKAALSVCIDATSY